MLLIRGLASTTVELLSYLWQRKLWWLLPVVVILLAFAALIVFGAATGAGPFIYTLF